MKTIEYLLRAILLHMFPRAARDLRATRSTGSWEQSSELDQSKDSASNPSSTFL